MFFCISSLYLSYTGNLYRTMNYPVPFLFKMFHGFSQNKSIVVTSTYFITKIEVKDFTHKRNRIIQAHCTLNRKWTCTYQLSVILYKLDSSVPGESFVEDTRIDNHVFFLILTSMNIHNISHYRPKSTKQQIKKH